MDIPTAPLIPSEEITLRLNAVDEALDLARAGGAHEGRNLLHQGRNQAEKWQGEPWGAVLLGLWERSVSNYEELLP